MKLSSSPAIHNFNNLGAGTTFRGLAPPSATFRGAGTTFTTFTTTFMAVLSLCLLAPPSADGAVWYVNDLNTAGDSFTTAHGYDTQPGTAAAPFRTLGEAFDADSLSLGDTIYVDSGTFSETFSIDSGSVSLIGVDSLSTVIDGGETGQTNNHTITIGSNIQYVLIKNVRVVKGYTGIKFNGADSATIENVTCSGSGQYAAYLTSTASDNLFKTCVVSDGVADGIVIQDGSRNRIDSCYIARNGRYGIYILNSSSADNKITNNTVEDHNGLNDVGVYIDNTATNNVIESNVIQRCARSIYLNNAANTIIRFNQIQNSQVVGTANSGYNLFALSGSGHVIAHNIFKNSNDLGLYFSGSSGNMVYQNTFDSNAKWQIYIDGVSSSDTFIKNNIYPSQAYPESGFYQASAAATNKFTITRNWWNTTDELKIKNRIFQKNNSDSVTFIPYRLGEVDTTSNGDSTAPAAPGTFHVANANVSGQVTIRWTLPALNEETSGGAVGYIGARVYRLANTADTTHWANTLVWTAGSADTSWIDTGVSAGNTYYYRIASRDAAGFVNESFFADTITAVPYFGPNWYVNDSHTTADSFTSAGGSDTSYGNGSASRPFRSLPMAMSRANMGDTLFIDAGTFDSYVHINGLNTETAGVNIDKDSITLIGVDSNATVIDPPGPNGQSGLSGVYADTQSGLRIKNLGVTGAFDGIHFYNVDASTIEGDSVTSCYEAIYLRVGSDSNSVKNNITNSNSAYGISLLSSSNGNTVTNSISNDNGSNGVYLNFSANNTISNNTLSSNGYAVYLISSANNNAFINNTLTANSTIGFYIDGSFLNAFKGNLVSGGSYGVYLSSGSNNQFTQNEFRGSSSWHIYLEGTATTDTFDKNNIFAAAGTGVNNIGTGAKFTFTRNWWGTADSVAIKAKFSGDTVIAWHPFRLGPADTAAGADTTAPKSPDTVAVLDTGGGQIKIEWSAVTGSEESNGGAVGLGGYRIYRSKIKDTSVWIKAGQVGSGVIQFTDTTLATATGYSYRVTAFDAATLENESFFSDSQPLDTAPALYAGPNWYVNDAYTGADSFTSASGADTGSADGSAQKPFRSALRALAKAKSHDTIWIDAGTYNDTTVGVTPTETAAIKIDTDYITIIGKDSNSTIISPNSTLTLRYGIYADSQIGLIIKNLCVNNAHDGIVFVNVDLSTISGDSLSGNGQTGLQGGGIQLLSGSDSNTLSGNITNNNSRYGIYLNASSDNTIRNSIASGNFSSGENSSGIAVFNGADRNLLIGNITDQNYFNGVWIQNSNYNRVTLHSAANNIYDLTGSGIKLDGDAHSVLDHNSFDSNTGYQIYITGVSHSDTFNKNIIKPSSTNPDSCIYLNSAASSPYYRATRNWWGTNDESVISKRIARLSADDVIVYSPYRLAEVDSAPGADTTAPAPPSGITLDTSVAGKITLAWIYPSLNEETNGGLVAFNGVKIYRLTNTTDTVHWANPANLVRTTNSSETNWTDTTAASGNIYSYRLTSRDTAAFLNESFFSDTRASVVDTVYAGPNWYVNDTWSSAIDSFTSAGGSDTSSGVGNSQNPYRTITKALSRVKSGDTIYIDGGLYAETVVIETDAISLIGKDSGATVIDPPGSSGTAGLYGIYATGRTGLLVKNIGVTGAYDGIRFDNVDLSTITSDSVCANGNYGIYLINGSDTNTISSSIANSNNRGIWPDASYGNTILRNTANSNSSYGMLATTGRNNTFDSNTANSNTGYGISLSTSSNNSVRYNTFNSNGTYGLLVEASSDTNDIRNNTANSNSGDGIRVRTTSISNTIDGNTTNFNTNTGIALLAGNNTVSGNTSDSNAAGNGITVSSSNNFLSGNVVRSNASAGIEFQAGMDNNRVLNNAILSNLAYGIYLNASSGNLVAQNEIRDNPLYQIYIIGASTSDTFQKNNIIPTPATPDSGVYIGSTSAASKFTFTRNWWNSTDTVRIKKLIFQDSNGDSVIWQPFRLGQVDTAAGADTTAPKSPDTVAIIGSPSDTSIILEWSAVTALEESNGGGVGLSGYRVYRSQIKDTSSWIQVAERTGIRYQDTDVAAGVRYYYRVMAFDAATPFANKSFFSDSQPSDSAVFTSTVNWYVNDGAYSSSTDSFTTAAGSDITGRGTVSKPFASIPMAMRLVTAGDTVYIDAGLYDSYVNINGLNTETAGINIDKDSITLVGKDSGATVIDPPGANTTSNLHGIYADTQVGLSIRNLGVTGAYTGIYFYNVDLSTISSDSAGACRNNGIHLDVASDTNTVTNTIASFTTSDNGILLDGSSGCTVSGNTAGNNNLVGIRLNSSVQWPSKANTVTNNTCDANFNGIRLLDCQNGTVSNNTANSNGNNGIILESSSTGNTVSGNTANANGDGIYIANSSHNNTVSNNTANNNSNRGFQIALGVDNNTFTSNIARNNGLHGFYIDNGVGHVLKHNLIDSNAQHGIYISGPSGHLIIDNDVTFNLRYQIYIDANASADTFQKNNIRVSAANPDSGVYNGATVTATRFTMTRNWWGTADSAALRKLIYQRANGDSVIYSPFRLASADTNSGADTTAPKAPDTVAAAGNDTSVTVTWQGTSSLEESNGGAVALSGYRVYRSAVKDTSSWIQVAQVGSATTNWQDTSVAVGSANYYRVTAFDTATPFTNESFFSDSQPSDSASFASRLTWYVNDTSVTGDSWVTATGSDVSGQGTLSSPFRTIMKAVSLASAGDTIVVDAGVYDSFVQISSTETAAVHIDKDSITLIGKDTASTVLDRGDSSATNGLKGIYASGRAFLAVRDIGVKNFYRGVEFKNVDTSAVQNVWVQYSRQYGIYLNTGSDNNRLIGNRVEKSVSDGIQMSSSDSVLVSGNTVLTSSDGIVFATSDSGTATNNTVQSSSQSGITSTGKYGLFTGNTVNSSSQHGFSFTSTGDFNTLRNNTVSGNGTHGIYFNVSNDNIVESNAISSNASSGIYMTTGGNDNRIIGNLIHNNGQYGVGSASSIGNILFQNRIDSNAEWAIYRTGGATEDTIQKNNILPSPVNPDSGISIVSTQAKFLLHRNWWGTTDEDAIRRKIHPASSADSLVFSPYRIGTVDTAPGADTTAPAKPANVSLDTTATAGAITVSWVIPAINEETNGGAVGFFGVNIYRLRAAPDTTHWSNPANLVRTGISSTETTWTDTQVDAGVTYYYRLTSKDTATFFNESFFTDTKFALPALAPNTGGRWYVNDSYSSSIDSFTTAGGSDTSGNGAAAYPYRTIMQALTQIKSGDTIYVDAGLYSETVVIDTDYVSLIGKDSSATVIDPPGANSTSGLYGIFADTQTGLLIKGLGITGSFMGIRMINIDQSVLTEDSIGVNGEHGIYLISSDTTTISKSSIQNNNTSGSGSGIYADSSSYLQILSNLIQSNGANGIYFSACVFDTISANTVTGNGPTGWDGISLNSGSNNNDITSNVANGNGYAGISLNWSSNLTVSGNVTSLNGSSGGVGIALNNSSNNLISNNSADTNGGSFGDGISVGSGTNNTLLSNTVFANAGAGIFLSASSNSLVQSNTAANNGAGSTAGVGIEISSCSGIRVVNNMSRSNIGISAGIGIKALSSSNILFALNTLDSNFGYQISLDGASASDTFVKNNFRTSSSNPDSGLSNTSNNSFDLTRNRWNTSDESKIAKMIFDTGMATSIKFSPYRLGPVDTTAGADTTAPAPPAGVTLDTAVAGQIKVTWIIPTIQEETNGGSVNFQGARIYRLKNSPDTSHWANALVWTAESADTTWTDTQVDGGATYYYRLTSRDGATFVNESFFSDTQWITAVGVAPASISIVSGNHQLADPGSAGTQPIRVRVLDNNGIGLAAETVSFTFTHPAGSALSSSGARLGDTAGITSTTAYTDGSGYLSETVVVGTTGDVFRVKAHVVRDSSKNVVFTAYADGRDIPDSSWRMLGPNKKLLTADPSTLTSGDLGAGTLIYEWREDKGVNSSLNSSKFHATPAMDRGRGYWVKPGVAGSRRWRIDEGTQGTAGFDTVRIGLNVGWNQIASGQYFYIDWLSSVKVDTGLSGDTWGGTNLSNMISMDSAHASGVMSKILYWYDGAQYLWGPNTLTSPSGTIVSGTSAVGGLQLKPMVGFWVKATSACTIWIFPNPADVAQTDTAILQQAPGYSGGQNAKLLSAYYKEQNKPGAENDWSIQIMASAGGKSDAQNYLGVRPTAQGAALAAVYEPPAAAGGFVALAVRPASNGFNPPSEDWLAASFAAPDPQGRSWDVAVASDVGGPLTLTWDNISNIPSGQEAYVFGGPNGPVNLRQSASIVLHAAAARTALQLAVGVPGYLAPFLAAPLSKEQTFAYPNPGPDGTGNVTFKYNLQGAADVKIKIFDVGGKLIREIKSTGAAGSNTSVWDITNTHGQKLASGVYLYILESGGNKLVDKLAIVR